MTGILSKDEDFALRDLLFTVIVAGVAEEVGNLTETTLTVNVDNLTPSLSLSPSGTSGNGGWYLSPLQITAAASDTGSGLAALEYTLDGGAWTAYTTPLTIPDGAHTYQFRATDNAGNTTQTPPQTANVDTQPPAITLPASWGLGRSADYSVSDSGSGLSSVRVVITDQQERYPKVHWDEAPSGAAFAGAIDWDGLWADKSKAQPGEYLAWVKAADNAGNESFAVGKIRVEGKNPLSGTGAPVITLLSLPTVTALPPVPASPLTPDTSHPTSFGGQTASSQVTSQITRFHPPTKPSPIQNRKSEIANLWWGGAAAGAAGAFLAESLRRKKEREKRLQDYHNRPKDGGEGEGKGNHLTGKQIAKAYQAAMSNFKATLQKAQSLGMSAAQAAQLQDDVAKSGQIGASLGAADGYIKQKEQERADWIEQQEAADAAFIQEMQAAQAATPPKPAFDPAKWKQSDYAESARWEAQQAYQHYRQGEWANPQPPKNWWEKVIDRALPNAGYIGTTGLAGYTAYSYRGLTIKNLDSGMVSVSAGNMPPGTRAAYFRELNNTSNIFSTPLRLKPGRYLPTTVRGRLLGNFIRGAANPLSWTVAGVGSLISNLYTFGYGHTSDINSFTTATVKKQEFWVSTAVDTVLSVAIGVGAAALVAATLPVTLPTAFLAAVAGGVALGISMAVYAPIFSEGQSVADVIKSSINRVIDTVQNEH